MTTQPVAQPDLTRLTAPHATLTAWIAALLELPSKVDQLGQQYSLMLRQTEQQNAQLREIVQKLTQAQRQNDTLQQQIDDIKASQTRLANALEALSQRQEVLEAASRREQQLLDAFYEEKVLEPLCRACFLIVDMIGETSSHETRANGDGVTAKSKLLRAVGEQLLQLLDGYGIEVFASSFGQPFDPKTMQRIGDDPTGDPSLDRTVSRCMRLGFRRSAKILRCESVRLHRFQPVISAPTEEVSHELRVN